MSSIDPVDSSVLGHVLCQHRDLHSRLLMLRSSFATPRPPDAASLANLRARLRSLREHLADHFAQEERGGFLEDSIARMPRLSAAAREVVAEHPRLLAELDGLLERLPVRDIRQGSWDEATRGFSAFADHLLSHERNENAVIQQGYNEDFGLPD
mgnify:CR=1 FL=1